MDKGIKKIHEAIICVLQESARRSDLTNLTKKTKSSSLKIVQGIWKTRWLKLETEIDLIHKLIMTIPIPKRYLQETANEMEKFSLQEFLVVSYEDETIQHHQENIVSLLKEMIKILRFRHHRSYEP